MGRPGRAPEQRAEALALYREHGPAEAARRTGVPKGTISRWAGEAGIGTVRNAKTKAATEAAQLSAHERKARLADHLLHLAEAGAGRSLATMQDASLRDAVGAFTRAIHDYQLLTGGETERDGGHADPGAALEQARARVVQLVPGRTAGVGD